MAIKMRRGNRADFIPSKMVAGEWGVVLDDKQVWITFAPGDCKQLMTTQDAAEQLRQAITVATAEAEGYADDAEGFANNAETSATNASTSETNAQTYANNAKASETKAKTSETNANGYQLISKSWAVGDTGVRSGEDTDNAKYYAQQANSLNQQSLRALDNANNAVNIATQKMLGVSFEVNLNTGELMMNVLDTTTNYVFSIDTTTGELMWEIR